MGIQDKLFKVKNKFSITRTILVIWFLILFTVYIYCAIKGKQLPNMTATITTTIIGLYVGRRNLKLKLDKKIDNKKE